MTTPITLSLAGVQHDQLKRFLFPSDGGEAVAVMLCGRRMGDERHKLIVRYIYEVPYAACRSRSSSRITWSPETIEAALEKAAEERLSVIKIHSHPNGHAAFSTIDDLSDKQLIPIIRGWVGANIPHGSAVMLPGGQMFGRTLQADGTFTSIATINVAGDDLHFWYPNIVQHETPNFLASQAQIFGSGTTERLRRLSISVIGCSGTGAPVIEQLFRLGVGELVLVDDDRIENRNVNRIPNSTMDDARKGRYKVEVIADAIRRAELGTRIIALPKNLWDPGVIRTVAQSDIIFGCMDTIDGRFLLNALATYYCLPYFDIGVRLDAVAEGPQKGRIREACGTVNYLQPGKSSLMSRGLFTMKEVGEAGLRRNDPRAHHQQISDGYISGVAEHRPAVISVNMFAASLAVNELLARLHPYREESNANYSSVTFSLASMELLLEREQRSCDILKDSLGIGDTQPPLGLIELAEKRAA